MKGRKITWTKHALRQFNVAIDYIRESSPQNADKVKEKILDKINGLTDDTVVHRRDAYKKDNDGSFLYFEIAKYRIVYQVKMNEIFIMRISHTSMEPKSY